MVICAASRLIAPTALMVIAVVFDVGGAGLRIHHLHHLGDLAGDLGAGDVLPVPRLGLAAHQHRGGLALDREGAEALELLDHHPARHRHVAGVGPGHLQRSSAHQVLVVEERQVEVVGLQRELVGLALGVLEGEADDAVAQVEGFSAGGPLVVEQGDANARGAAIDNGVHPRALLPASPRITSVSTGSEGMKIRRPGSSSRVGSMIGSSGWKSAMAHQMRQARGSGAK